MKAETKVGLMFLSAFLMVVGFAYYLGAINPFSRSKELSVAYNFAGGIEVGSPVRVMGIKVGRVRSISFEPDLQMPNGEEVKLRVHISVDREAWSSVREDSRYFINLAGVIGEKFLEITPGSAASPMLKPGVVVRGEDPPRIDQLISQSYGLAGKIMDFVESNEGNVIETIETLNKLVVNFDKLLKQVDQTSQNKDVARLLQNMITISDDMAALTQQMRGPEGQKTVALLNRLLQRLEPLDAAAIRKFLQEEGIRARIF